MLKRFWRVSNDTHRQAVRYIYILAVSFAFTTWGIDVVTRHKKRLGKLISTETGSLVSTGTNIVQQFYRDWCHLSLWSIIQGNDLLPMYLNLRQISKYDLVSNCLNGREKWMKSLSVSHIENQILVSEANAQPTVPQRICRNFQSQQLML